MGKRGQMAMGCGFALLAGCGDRLEQFGGPTMGSTYSIQYVRTASTPEYTSDDRQVAEKIIAVDGVGVSTSGDYRNYFQQDGRRYSHTLNARTAAPITHRLASVTVLHPSALMADGLSTLLLILGPEQAGPTPNSTALRRFLCCARARYLSHAVTRHSSS